MNQSLKDETFPRKKPSPCIPQKVKKSYDQITPASCSPRSPKIKRKPISIFKELYLINE